MESFAVNLLLFMCVVSGFTFMGSVLVSLCVAPFVVLKHGIGFRDRSPKGQDALREALSASRVVRTLTVLKRVQTISWLSAAGFGICALAIAGLFEVSK